MSSDLVSRLRGLLGPAAVLTGAADTEPYLTDWRGRYTGRALCVVKPASTAEVAAVVALCAQRGVPMVPQGGNTGLVGGATPDGAGRAVLINLSRLNRVRDVDTDNNTLTVEAGCTLQQVQDAAGSADRFFPLTLASQGSCQVGGNLSTNAGGVNVLRYGNMRDQVLGLEVVLPDGQVWNGLRGLYKDNTGYGLKHLFIGAEGTLGIVTAAVLKLYARPREQATAWVAVDSADAAVALLGRLRMECGERVTGFELVGRAALELVLKHIPGVRDPLPKPAPWYLLVELSDTRPGPELYDLLERILAREMEAGLVPEAAMAHNRAQTEQFWALRENISEAQRIEGISIKHDVSVPVSRIAEFVCRADEALAGVFGAVRIVCFGHVGDGNLHYNLSRHESQVNADFIARTGEANRIVHDLVTELGGSISAEHGIGQLKRDELSHYRSPLELDLMRRIKDALDPAGLMNPGKVLKGRG
ncbi:MAG: FAD-binding oxidoreductase [Rhodocyclaceae bacterium]|nr:FAD-binding oxidoreductase [Rhodocyclaceae bacterium]